MGTGRTPPTFDLPGYLELVDRPAEATPSALKRRLRSRTYFSSIFATLTIAL